jgi:uncharacterized protein DUF5709
MGISGLMTDDDFDREPEYDPESVGFPDTIDPDSSAYDEDESVREADGPTTPLAPYYTAAGLDPRDDSQLDQRLRAEVPDVSADDPAPDPRRVDSADDEWEADEDPEDDEDPQDPVGRLAEESGGGQHTTYALDEGLAGGGESAEEAAMHLTEGTDLDEDADE